MRLQSISFDDRAPGPSAWHFTLCHNWPAGAISLISSWTSRRLFHSLIEGWKTTEQREPAERDCAFSARFQPIALSSWPPCLNRICRCCFWLPTSRGWAGDFQVGGQQQGPGIADAVWLELFDLLDDSESQSSQQDLGVDHDFALELLLRE